MTNIYLPRKQNGQKDKFVAKNTRKYLYFFLKSKARLGDLASKMVGKDVEGCCTRLAHATAFTATRTDVIASSTVSGLVESTTSCSSDFLSDGNTILSGHVSHFCWREGSREPEHHHRHTNTNIHRIKHATPPRRREQLSNNHIPHCQTISIIHYPK